MLGEITSDAAKAVGQSDATKIFIPVNKCENLVAGVTNISLTALISDALSKLDEIINENLK